MCRHTGVPPRDPENRLAQVGAPWTYGCTGDGPGARKATNGVPTYFYYDGAAPVLETDGLGNVRAVNNYGPNGLLSRHTSAGTTYYTFDPQGSVTQGLNSTGGLIDNHLFDAYGTEQSPKSAGDPFAFGAQWGYYTDQATSGDTGMVLCGWRYYDPLTGRFLTRDPIGYAGGLNLYAFAANNPVSYTDPSGTNPLICGAVGAGEGALISGGVAYPYHQEVSGARPAQSLKGSATSPDKARRRQLHRPCRVVECSACRRSPPAALPTTGRGETDPRRLERLPLPQWLGKGAGG